MDIGKAFGPNGTPIKVWKCVGEQGIIWLIELFNEIMRSKEMTDEWRKNILVPIFKSEGDVLTT